MPTPRIALTITTAALALTGTAGLAAAASGGATTLKAAPQHQIAAAGDDSPIDFAGAREARHGKPLPAGDAVEGRDLTITEGTRQLKTTFTLSCPGAKRIRSIGGSHGVAADPVHHTTAYVGKRKATFLVSYDARGAKPGDTVTGTALVLCR